MLTPTQKNLAERIFANMLSGMVGRVNVDGNAARIAAERAVEFAKIFEEVCKKK